MAATQELDLLDCNPGSLIAYSEREGLDPMTPEAVREYSVALADFRALCLGESISVEQVTVEGEVV